MDDQEILDTLIALAPAIDPRSECPLMSKYEALKKCTTLIEHLEHTVKMQQTASDMNFLRGKNEKEELFKVPPNEKDSHYTVFMAKEMPIEPPYFIFTAPITGYYDISLRGAGGKLKWLEKERRMTFLKGTPLPLFVPVKKPFWRKIVDFFKF